MRRAGGAIVAALLAAAGLAASARAEPPKAQTASGALQGVRQGKVDAYLGVPFAAPPVGPARWKAPAPAPSWTGVRAADKFGASCWQPVSSAGFGPWTHEYVVDGPVSEDCLFLNVWTPAAAGSKRPVLVWIHGGAFTSGSGSVPIYNGAALAAEGVVVVTVNYRLGVLGFLAHPGITEEAGADPPGNFGLQDMIAALKWVRQNIAAFGGDPDSVTIDGQSAGAMAIHDLIESPMAAGLFRRALIESGLPGIAPTVPLASAEAAGEAYAKAKGAGTLEALRALPPEKLAGGAGGPLGFAPIRDGVLLPATPDPAKFNDTPVLIGMNADEDSAMSPSYGATDPAKIDALLHESYGDAATRFSAFYPTGTDAERAAASPDILRDRGLAALHAWTQGRLEHSRSPLYAYLYTHVEPGAQAARFRAFHSAEIPYAFRTLGASPERPFTDADRLLSQQISTYWLNFIRTGDPNGGGLPAWPQVTTSSPTIMAIGDKIEARPILPPAKLQAVDAFLSQGGEPRLF
jgi:para-nitrobenzyl esterase